MCVTAFHVYLYILHFVTSRFLKYIYILCFIFAPSYSSCSTFLNIIYIFIYSIFIYNKSVLSHLFAAFGNPRFLHTFRFEPYVCELTKKRLELRTSAVSFRQSMARLGSIIQASSAAHSQRHFQHISKTLKFLLPRKFSLDVNDERGFIAAGRSTTFFTRKERAPLICAGCLLPSEQQRPLVH